MRNYIQPGHAITLAAPYDVVSGAGLLVGSIFGVASHDALSGAEVETQLTGVIDLAKVASQAWTAGAKVYWDNTARRVTNVASGNTLVGVAVLAVGAGADEIVGRVRLNGASERWPPSPASSTGCSPIRTSGGTRPTSRRTGSRSPSASSPGGPTPSPSSASARLWSETTRFDVRVAEVANPRPGDRLVLDGETFVVQGEPVRDRERLVWTLDVRPA